jgi:hypothetical protein
MLGFAHSKQHMISSSGGRRYQMLASATKEQSPISDEDHIQPKEEPPPPETASAFPNTSYAIGPSNYNSTNNKFLLLTLSYLLVS